MAGGGEIDGGGEGDADESTSAGALTIDSMVSVMLSTLKKLEAASVDATFSWSDEMAAVAAASLATSAARGRPLGAMGVGMELYPIRGGGGSDRIRNSTDHADVYPKCIRIRNTRGGYFY